MENNMADALLDFYQKILKPEFDRINSKLAEHDERFSEVFGHFDTIYHRLGKMEDEHLAIMNRLSRIEDAIRSGNESRAQLEKRVNDMKELLADLQARLEALERQLGF